MGSFRLLTTLIVSNITTACYICGLLSTSFYTSLKCKSIWLDHPYKHARFACNFANYIFASCVWVFKAKPKLLHYVQPGQSKLVLSLVLLALFLPGWNQIWYKLDIWCFIKKRLNGTKGSSMYYVIKILGFLTPPPPFVIT